MVVAKKNFFSTKKKTPRDRNKSRYFPPKKKSWRPNTLPDKWEKLQENSNWKKLSKIEQQILKLGWPHRYLHLSYREIASFLHIHRNGAIRIMKKLETMGLITKKKDFIKKKNGCLTKIHKRNYYVFTDAGKATIDILIKRLFAHTQNEPLKNLTKVRKNMPSENPQDNFQNKKFSDLKKMFIKYSFGNQICRAYNGTIHILLTHPIEKIEKILKLMEKKIQKGWKPREFWGFFLNILKKPQKISSFFPYLANAYLETLSGKHSLLTRGIDSHIIVESLGKLQKNGETITQKTLARILQYGTQKVKTALEGICYRSYLGRGVLPEPKAETKNPQKPKKRPITKLVKIRAQTGDIYSAEDYQNGEEFSMTTIIVGYEEIEAPRKERKIQHKTPFTKIRSWIGLLIETLETCRDCESIHRRYFFSQNKLSA